MNIQQKVALVTGASEGIGRRVVERLAERGVRCIAVSRHVEDISFENDHITAKNCNIRDPEQVEKLFAWVGEAVGSLDILVNNAGVWHKSLSIDDMSHDMIDEVIGTNLLGTLYVTKHGLPLLRQSPEAALVNVISSAGLKAQAGRAAYAASKFGVRGFTDALREDLRGTNIGVIAVYQGGTDTRMFTKAGDSKDQTSYIDPDDLAEYIVYALEVPKKMWLSELRVDHT